MSRRLLLPFPLFLLFGCGGEAAPPPADAVQDYELFAAEIRFFELYRSAFRSPDTRADSLEIIRRIEMEPLAEEAVYDYDYLMAQLCYYAGDYEAVENRLSRAVPEIWRNYYLGTYKMKVGETAAGRKHLLAAHAELTDPVTRFAAGKLLGLEPQIEEGLLGMDLSRIKWLDDLGNEEILAEIWQD